MAKSLSGFDKILEEDKRQDEAKANNASGAGSQAVVAKKDISVKGRPKTKPASKLVSYNLSLDLIARIEAGAEEYTTGNKSALITRAVEMYLAAKAKAK